MKLPGKALAAEIVTNTMTTTFAMTAFTMTTALIMTTAIASAQDAGKGKTVFNQCQACHALDKAMVGPGLAGVIGRKAGSYAGYSYSPLLKAAGEAGLTWNETELVDYLKNPTEYLKKYVADKGKEASGASRMTYSLANEQQRKPLITHVCLGSSFMHQIDKAS